MDCSQFGPHELAADVPRPTPERISWTVYEGLYERVLTPLLNGPPGRTGPNMLSINSPSLIPLYSSMAKSDTYQRHTRTPGYELFFKPDSETQHRQRRRAWAGLFTTTGYICSYSCLLICTSIDTGIAFIIILTALYVVLTHAHSNSLDALMPALERRTMELARCIEKRKTRADGQDLIDLKEALSHWAFDFTVRERNPHAGRRHRPWPRLVHPLFRRTPSRKHHLCVGRILPDFLNGKRAVDDRYHRNFVVAGWIAARKRDDLAACLRSVRAPFALSGRRDDLRRHALYGVDHGRRHRR